MKLLQTLAALIHLPSESSPAGQITWAGILRSLRVACIVALSYVAVATLNALIGDIGGNELLDEQSKVFVTMALTGAIEYVRQWATDYTKA